ncbi:Endonuclease/Exonuclease/phosphatase family protein [Kiritimatiella glycovorans]|uniref:Endonuclease/Exonuclease/phosphatase family protein n=2 Tax=Kiritimatiella glycovorans TaxID=1307763 RepID=A0A0G3EI47_9BACT|nr:Endonuclease/Exonuclease/phosphatase family protein [Kiritimatiella glycovorans]
MRLLLYNIRYGTGPNRFFLPCGGYLGDSTRNIEAISDFVASCEPDVAGLVEVDEGSFRTGHRNQAEQMAARLGHYHIYRSKYHAEGWTRFIPVMNKQGNAFLTRDSIEPVFHYFKRGMKKLIIELELENVVIFLVHLALQFRTRHQQLAELYNLVERTEKPVIVAGDFNALWGENEIDLFLGATRLTSANENRVPTFPSWKPRRHLDFILHSPEIHSVRFDVPQVELSDHLPLVWDFEVEPQRATP